MLWASFACMLAGCRMTPCGQPYETVKRFIAVYWLSSGQHHRRKNNNIWNIVVRCEHEMSQLVQREHCFSNSFCPFHRCFLFFLRVLISFVVFYYSFLIYLLCGKNISYCHICRNWSSGYNFIYHISLDITWLASCKRIRFNTLLISLEIVK